MAIELIDDKARWNGFILKNAPRSGAFLQTYEWGEFQRAVGHDPVRLAIVHAGEMVAAGQFMRRPLVVGKEYVYCPRGPIVKEADSVKVLDAFAGSEYLQSEIFIRFEPLQEVPDDRSVQNNDVQPSHTLILDLSPDEDDIMMGMHSKTRYNVRLAGRKGVEVDIDPDIEFDEVWSLFKETADRGGFVQHKKHHFKHMLDVLSGDNCRAFLAVARYEDEILAVNIMLDCNGVRTYLHGASSSKHRSVMAPYKLHWELIKEAKENGMQKYDWWGVKPKDAGKDHPLHGVTRFKEKFGGEYVEYPGTFDYPINQFWYKAYKLARMMKK